MAKWYDEWLTPQERKSLQVGQKGIRARRRMQQDPENTRGYPKSGDAYQKQAAANAPKRATENKPVEQKDNKKMVKESSSRKVLETAFKKKGK